MKASLKPKPPRRSKPINKKLVARKLQQAPAPGIIASIKRDLKLVIAIIMIALLTGAIVHISRNAFADTGLKPMGAGLYVRNGNVPANMTFIDHSFYNGRWADFEPTQGNFNGPGWGEIDAIIKQHPNIKLRLRIEAGINAPEWVKNIGGSCVYVELQTRPENNGCVPRFWLNDYLNAYQRFMNEVARRYDNNANVLDVVNSACMTINAEPFIKGGKSAGAALNSAGLDYDGDLNCFRRSMADMNSSFKRTRISLATHENWQIAIPGGIRSEWEPERALLQEFRSKYGTKLIVQNNGLAEQTCPGTPKPESASGLYCYIKSISPPKGFQQGCGDKVAVCDQAKVADNALALGACFLEHASWAKLANAQEYDKRLKNNAGCQANSTTPPASNTPSPGSQPSPSTTQTPSQTQPGSQTAKDQTPPAVKLTYPNDSDILSATITIKVEATDNVGTKSVVLFINNRDTATASHKPYEFKIDTTKYANAKHSIFVRAYDTSGNMAQSQTIAVHTDNGSNVSADAIQPPSNSNTQAITRSTPGTMDSPIIVSESFEVLAEQAGSQLVVYLNDTKQNGNIVDVSKLANGYHKLSIHEDGEVYDKVILVQNPLRMAVLNHVRTHSVEYTGATTAVVAAAAGLLRRRLFGVTF